MSVQHIDPANKHYYISYNALSFENPWMGNNGVIGVSIHTGTVVKVFYNAVTWFNTGTTGDYKQWEVEGYSSRIPSTAIPASGKMFIYLKIDEGNDATCMIIFSPVMSEEYRNSCGTTMKDMVNGNVDMLSRPIVTSDVMTNAGWASIAADSKTTLFPQAYEIGTTNKKTLLVTPILADGTVLTPAELKDYVGSLTCETPLVSDAEGKNIVIHLFSDADISKKDTMATELTSLQSLYYLNNYYKVDKQNATSTIHYVPIGTMDAKRDANGALTGFDIKYDTGRLGTDDYYENVNNDMFKLDSNLIYPLYSFARLTVNGILKVIDGIEIAGKKLSKVLTSDSQDNAEGDEEVVTAGWLVKKWWARYSQMFLRKDQDDYTPHRLAMDKAEVAPDPTPNSMPASAVATYGKTIDSMLAGSGAMFTADGRLQVDRLEVRTSMTVMEMIINQLHAMDGEYYFGDAAIIESVVPYHDGEEDTYDADGTNVEFEDGSNVKVSTSSYYLYFKHSDEYEGAEKNLDAFKWRAGDIIFSIISNLSSRTNEPVQYYQSWMRCISTDAANYRILVVLYPDALVGGGHNYPPEAGYACARRGNVNSLMYGPKGDDNAEEWVENRQSAWNLSARDGSMTYFDDLSTPKPTENNYKLVLGKMPGVGPMKDYEGRIGLYSDLLLYSEMHQVVWAGKTRHNYIDHGDWSVADAALGAYKYNKAIDADNWTTITQSRVYHHGFLWGCIANDCDVYSAEKAEHANKFATGEPKWSSSEWAVLSGGRPGDYTIQIVSSGGDTFYVNDVKTTLTARLYFNNQDITDDAVNSDMVSWTWERISGTDTLSMAEDNTWGDQWKAGTRPGHSGDSPVAKNSLYVTNDDMGSNWSNALSCTFKVTAIITVSNTVYKSEAEVVMEL